MKTPEPDELLQVEFETTCGSISVNRYDQLYDKATRADRRKINRIVRSFLPDLANNLGLFQKSLKDLRWFNPYKYYKTETHLILVHSQIDYFIKYERK